MHKLKYQGNRRLRDSDRTANMLKLCKPTLQPQQHDQHQHTLSLIDQQDM
jgi:hypothetical protein